MTGYVVTFLLGAMAGGGIWWFAEKALNQWEDHNR